MARETAVTYKFNGHDVSVVRQFDDQGDFHCYDLFLDENGQCLNEGAPWLEGEGSATLTEPPTADEVLAFLLPTYGEMLLDTRLYRVVHLVEVSDERKETEDREGLSDEEFMAGEFGFAGLAMETVSLCRVPEPIDNHGINPMGLAGEMARLRELQWNDMDIMTIMSVYIEQVDHDGFAAFLEQWANEDLGMGVIAEVLARHTNAPKTPETPCEGPA